MTGSTRRPVVAPALRPSALDADESRRLFEDRGPALVVLDLMISGGRGLALCRALAERGARVVALSSVAQRSRAVE